MAAVRGRGREGVAKAKGMPASPPLNPLSHALVWWSDEVGGLRRAGGPICREDRLAPLFCCVAPCLSCPPASHVMYLTSHVSH